VILDPEIGKILRLRGLVVGRGFCNQVPNSTAPRSLVHRSGVLSEVHLGLGLSTGAFLELGVAMAGAFGSVAFLHVLLRIRRERQRKRGESRPVDSKLLRPAGYSLSLECERQLERVVEDSLGLAVAGALVGIGVLKCVALILVATKSGDGWAGVGKGAYMVGPAVLCVGGIAWVYLGRRVWRGLQRRAELELGWRGEMAVGEALNHHKVMKGALAIFHDVPGDGDWNIDHVVVTRAGIFVIETKARTKRTGRHSLEADSVECAGEVIRFPYWNDESTVMQADRNARWMRRLISPHLSDEYPVWAVIVLPGWRVRNPDGLKIPVKRANDLVQYIDRTVTGTALLESDEKLAPVVDLLDGRCRTVEF